MAVFTRLFGSDTRLIGIDIESQEIIRYDSVEKEMRKDVISVYEEDSRLHLVIPYEISSLINDAGVEGHQIIIETDTEENCSFFKNYNQAITLEIMLDLLIILTLLLFLQLLYMGYKSGLLFKII